MTGECEACVTDIYEDDIKAIDENKVIPQEPRRESLHRLIQAGKRAIEEAKGMEVKAK